MGSKYFSYSILIFVLLRFHDIFWWNFYCIICQVIIAKFLCSPISAHVRQRVWKCGCRWMCKTLLGLDVQRTHAFIMVAKKIIYHFYSFKLTKNERFWKKWKILEKMKDSGKNLQLQGVRACRHKTCKGMFAKNTAHYYSTPSPRLTRIFGIPEIPLFANRVSGTVLGIPLEFCITRFWGIPLYWNFRATWNRVTQGLGV